MGPNTPFNPGGLFCHYWLLCEQGRGNAASSERRLVAGAAARSPCQPDVLCYQSVTHTRWKMPDKHHTGNERPPSSSSPPFLSGSLSGLRIAAEMELLILNDTARVERSDETYKVRAGECAA